MAALIETEGLSRHFPAGEEVVKALSGVSVSIAPGEFVAAMGPSGSGKSTFLNLIGCLDRPTEGRYRLMGEEVETLSQDRLAALRSRRIGFVFQSFNLLPRADALANVELPLVYRGLRRRVRRDRAAEALAAVGLGDRMRHRPSQLSGGQQQRVAIARAIVGSPDLLLADEPTGALDTRTGLSVAALFQALNRGGVGVLMVTHDADVARFASRVLRFRDGRLVGDTRQDPADAAALLAELPAMDQGGMNAPGAITRAAAPASPPSPVLPPLPAGHGGMDLAEAFRGALAALAANTLRSILTALGIFIGVAAVIATVAVGEGARRQVTAQIQSLGANLLIIWGGSATMGGVRLGAGGRSNLSWDDALAIAREVPQVEVAVGSIRQTFQMVAGNQNWSAAVVAADPDFFIAHEWTPETGRLFGAEEANGARKVVILGATVAENLFGEEDPVGREVRIRSTPFEVIGVMARKGQNPMGQDQDDTVFIPYWTARRSVMGASRANARQVGAISVKVHEGEDMREAEENIRALMRQRHRVAANEPDSVSVRNLSDIQATRDAAARTLSLLLASVAAVSLLVGGIGVMNIMLVSVTERTREIGLRLAVGARQRDVLAQFLLEAMVLALLGGAVGVVAGITLSHLVADLAGWPVLVTADSVLLAVGVSALTGLFFGFWPARRAARLDPIAALRHD